MFSIYIPQIKDFDIVIFSVATGSNVLYNARDSVKILMALHCVHIILRFGFLKT